jgi:hypothetical protein
MLATNNDWAAPLDMDDRRFCVVDVLDTKVGKHDYFKKIRHELVEGGFAALLYDLLHEDLSKFNHRKPPLTDAGLRQKILGMTPEQRWWFGKLVAGELLPRQGWPRYVPKGGLHDNYIHTLEKAGVSRRAMEMELADRLTDWVPGWKGMPVKDRSSYRNGERCWDVPSLERCRVFFEEHVIKQPVAWGDDLLDLDGVAA